MEFIKPRFTGSVGLSGSLEVTGTVNVLNGITGSLFGTASYALNAGDSLPYRISSGSATASINFDVSGSSSLQINTDTLITGSLVVTGSLTVGPNANTGIWGVAVGLGTTASGDHSFAQGEAAGASGIGSHAEGVFTSASGHYSHAEGYQTIALGVGSHAEGTASIASGDFSHAEGELTLASGSFTHAEGLSTIASGIYSHAEGAFTIASNTGSHAEGLSTTSSGDFSHAEGQDTVASGGASHAEGFSTIASGVGSHAEGLLTSASGIYSHAEGQSTVALGTGSHAQGLGTSASGDYQSVQGRYNATASTALWILGDGTTNTDKKNLITAYTNNVHVSGAFNVSGTIQMWQSASVSGTNIFGTSSWAGTASFLDGFIGQGVTLSFLTASTTWSVNHGLNTLYPLVSIWESGSEEIMQPDVIESKNLNTTEIRFTIPRAGYANIGIAGAPLYQASPFFTASFALTASFFSGSINVANAVSSSYVSGSGAVVATGSVGVLDITNNLVASYLSTANYADDTAAAAGGVPLYGVYRSGNMLLVRIV